MYDSRDILMLEDFNNKKFRKNEHKVVCSFVEGVLNDIGLANILALIVFP